MRDGAKKRRREQYEVRDDVVPLTGLEPVQYRYRGILSPLCLPIPPQRHGNILIELPCEVKGNLRWTVFPRPTASSFYSTISVPPEERV